MKKGIALILLAVVLGGGIISANINPFPLFTLQTIMVDSFSTTNPSFFLGSTDPIEWTVVTSRHAAEGFPQTALANAWPQDKYGSDPANAADLMAFAINGSFTQRGDNWLEVRPGRGGNPEPLPLPGRVQALSMWVWGSNFNYQLDAIFLDVEGIEHRVPMGNLRFRGWRNLTAVIPDSIKQLTDDQQTFPLRPELRLSRFIITTDIRERVDEFFIYFSDVTVLTHISLWESFDGFNLTQPETLTAIWGERPQAVAPAPAPTPAPGQPVISVTSPQANPGVGGDNPAFQQLAEVQVSTMADPVFWVPRVSSDFGSLTMRAFPGGPANKPLIAGDDSDPADNRMLGIRVNFNRRGAPELTLRAVRPLAVEGIVRVVSVWVAGRNAPHTLFLQIRDFDGNLRELNMGDLNFTGWRQMSVAIPSSIRQQHRLNNHEAGISIVGFRVRFHLPDTGGAYFIYFNDLRALTDLSPLLDGRTADDPMDNW